MFLNPTPTRLPLPLRNWTCQGTNRLDQSEKCERRLTGSDSEESTTRISISI